MFLKSFFLFLSVVTVNATFSLVGVKPYTKIAHTQVFGRFCIGGCSEDRECVITKWPFVKFPCTISNELSLIYFTAQVRANRKYCISNCGNFNFKLKEWCFTTTEGDWDYCSSKPRVHQPGVPLGSELGGYTTDGTNCITECTQGDDSKHFYWCNYKSFGLIQKWNYCAPPALSKLPILTSTYTAMKSPASNCYSFLKINLDNVSAWNSLSRARNGYIEEIANTLQDVSEWTPEITVHQKYDESAVVKSYTLVNVLANGENALVPVVIKANVGNKVFDAFNITLRSRFRRASAFRSSPEGDGSYNYHQLIGENIGGPDEAFNYAPLSANLRGMLDSLEEGIEAWCEEDGRSVDILMVIFYHDYSTKVPSALGIDLTLKNSDGSVFLKCDDSIYFNRL